MIAQVEMALSPSGPDRHVSAEALQALRKQLADGQWHTAKSIAFYAALNDRELRAIVEEHGSEFVTGNKGYRLMSAATVDEIREAAGRLLSQADKMRARAITLLNTAHRRLHQAPPSFANFSAKPAT